MSVMNADPECNGECNKGRVVMSVVRSVMMGVVMSVMTADLECNGECNKGRVVMSVTMSVTMSVMNAETNRCIK